MSLLLTFFKLAMKRSVRQFNEDLRKPNAAQLRSLKDILEANRDSAFGREHSFSSIADFNSFRKAVPIRSYDEFSPWIEKMKAGADNQLVSQPLEMFATTSGTSSEPKFCPVTRRFTLEHHRTHLHWMYDFAFAHPATAAGKCLTVISPAEVGRTPGGTPYGASSGRQYLNQAIPVRRKHPIPYEAFCVKNYTAKYHAILAFALAYEIRTATSVNPSSLALLGTVLRERAPQLIKDIGSGTLANADGITPDERKTLEQKMRANSKRARMLLEILKSDGELTPKTAWPSLAAIVTWQGGSAPFYLSQVRELWGDAPQRCLGLRASEGTFSIPLRDNDPSGVIAVGGHVMEFIEENIDLRPDSETLLAHELESGKRYRTIITTSGGFYRYDLADIVEVTGFNCQTPEIRFLHKAGNTLSVTGEKITEDQAVAVMEKIGRGFPEINGFTLTQELLNPPRLLLAIELSPEAAATDEKLRAILSEFEKALCNANEEYSGKRNSGRLGEPSLLVLETGSYRAHRAELIAQGKPDGQIKPPHLVRPAGEGQGPVKGCPFFDRVKIIRRLDT